MSDKPALLDPLRYGAPCGHPLHPVICCGGRTCCEEQTYPRPESSGPRTVLPLVINGTITITLPPDAVASDEEAGVPISPRRPRLVTQERLMELADKANACKGADDLFALPAWEVRQLLEHIDTLGSALDFEVGDYCRACGCTEQTPCDPPCGWATEGLCTACRFDVQPCDDGEEGWVVIDRVTGDTLTDEHGQVVYMKIEDAIEAASAGVVRMDHDGPGPSWPGVIDLALELSAELDLAVESAAAAAAPVRMAVNRSGPQVTLQPVRPASGPAREYPPAQRVVRRRDTGDVPASVTDESGPCMCPPDASGAYCPEPGDPATGCRMQQWADRVSTAPEGK